MLGLACLFPCRAEAFTCEPDTTSRLAKETVLDDAEPSGTLYFDKAFILKTDGGTFVEKRFCNESGIAQTSELYAFGKRVGTLRHVDYWSGRDLTLVDDEGRVRVIKTNISGDFERVLIFDDKGQPAVPLAQSETGERTFAATAFLLHRFAEGKVSDGIILVWMTHYHGEHNGAENWRVFAVWLMRNREKGLAFLARLDKDTSRFFGETIYYGVIEGRQNEREAFKAMFKRGDSPATDKALDMMDRE